VLLATDGDLHDRRTRCTRRCGFCAVDTARPSPLDPSEPARIARGGAPHGLRHVVVTAVARDDLHDGGPHTSRATIRAVRAQLPSARVRC